MIGRAHRRRERTGFTLVELMIAVAVIGVLAAVALPSFLLYTIRAKTSESVNNLKAIYSHANAYYSGRRTAPGLGANIVGRCIVDPTVGFIPPAPGPAPQQANFSADPAFVAIGLPSAESLYYGYGIDSPGTNCGTVPLDTNVYTFFAIGDLDGDAVQSRFELACGTDVNAELFRAPGFFVQNELE